MPAPARSAPPGWLWVHVGVAAAAMVATLPGRTHGLGLVTEPLLRAFAPALVPYAVGIPGIDEKRLIDLARVPYATLNLWATLIGAAFCLPVGWLLDRLGVRAVLAGVTAVLGVVVLLMADLAPGGRTISLAPTIDDQSVNWFTSTPVPIELFLLVTLTRGLGQSALSVVSLALMGKAAGRKSGLVVGVYSFVMAIGFMAAFGGIGHVLKTPDREAKAKFEADTQAGTATGSLDDYKARARDEHRDLWRSVWGGIGWSLLGAAIVLPLLIRRLRARPDEAPDGDDAERPSLTLPRALLTPGFWVFGLATSFYGMLASGLSLFNQSVLKERGFELSVFLTITTLGPLVGLASNLLCGGLARAGVRLGYLLAGALTLQGVALVLFPHVTTLTEVYAYAAAMGVAGGALTVVFFAYWTQAYGPKHLGRIQGMAQMLTVFASAVGPLVLAAGQRYHGSYSPVIQQLSIASFVFAVAAAVVPMPKRPQADSSAESGVTR